MLSFWAHLAFAEIESWIVHLRHRCLWIARSNKLNRLKYSQMSLRPADLFFYAWILLKPLKICVTSNILKKTQNYTTTFSTVIHSQEHMANKSTLVSKGKLKLKTHQLVGDNQHMEDSISERIFRVRISTMVYEIVIYLFSPEAGGKGQEDIPHSKRNLRKRIRIRFWWIEIDFDKEEIYQDIREI